MNVNLFMKFLIIMIFLGVAIVQPQEQNTDSTKQKITNREKFPSWIGEKVILLKDEVKIWDFYGEGMAHGDGTYEFHMFGDPKQGLPYDEYAGRTGTITDFLEDEWEFIIVLDDRNEKICAGISDYLGFFSEMEVAQKLVGQQLWAQGRIDVDKNIFSNKYGKVKVKNIERVTISRIEWGIPFHPLLIYLKTDSGKEGSLSQSYYIDDKYYGVNTNCKEFLDEANLDKFYLEDPRTIYQGWSDEIWKSIQNGEVTIGMTEEMAKVTCGGEFKKFGIEYDSNSKKTFRSYKCGRKWFIIENGKVTRFID